MRAALKKATEYVACASALGPDPSARLRILWHQTKNVRARLRLARHRPERVYTLRTTYGALHLRDNFGDVTNLLPIFHSGVYDHTSLEDDGAIVDVGANIGLAAAWFRFHNPGRRILCVEPLPGNAAMIPRNCPEAEVVQAAVGSRRGVAVLRADPDGVMATIIPTAWETDEVRVEVRTLDEIMSERGIAGVALLKVDTEGMEIEVLDGGRETLARTARVVMETHGKTRHRTAIERLESAGFRVDRERLGRGTGLVFASAGRAR